MSGAWTRAALLLGALAMMGMGQRPWDSGWLVSVGNAPFTKLAIQQAGGKQFVILRSSEPGAVSLSQLDELAGHAGEPVRFRVLRWVDSPLQGRAVVLGQIETQPKH
ncbi:hypothetical protein [Chromobacterium haemolyticum]|uniref:hypothetical protein n=1 Tax=Chromobacterium haemolyticum TaxID=394935 RepID=UPI0005BA5BD9|nr:hypothetical protein [Chromobacterium haemolyticum]